jgi:hypothetical protein
MSPAARWSLAIALVASFVWAGAVAVTAGMTGTVGWYGNQYLQSGGPRRDPDAAARHWAQVKEAARKAPADPWLQELSALLELRVNGKSSRDTREGLERALELRPSSASTWANLAADRYRSGDTAHQFVAAVEHAAELGPYEPEVQAMVAFYGLAVWNELNDSARRAVDSMVGAGMKRNPMEMLQISQRRGRLDVACRHLDGIPRQTDPKWLRLCKDQIREDMS